jgi:two-component system response regulator YesN
MVYLFHYSQLQELQADKSVVIWCISMFNALIVEDSKIFRETLSDLLISHFPTIFVKEACDAQDALTQMEISRPDIIFMDIDLPGENGLELTREIKEVYKSIVIIILSGYDIPEYRQQAYRNGADCFISKGGRYCMSDVLARVEGTMASKILAEGEGRLN